MLRSLHRDAWMRFRARRWEKTPKLCLRLLLALATMALYATPAWAQAGAEDEVVAGMHELQVWTALGHSAGSTGARAGIWNGGFRYGWVLTDPHGSGFLRGRFEYGVDAIPVFVIFEPAQTAYGVSFDPFALRWNFRQRHNIMPYTEITGGVLFTNRQVPPTVNQVNFTTSAGIGISVPRRGYRWSAELHAMHISDANLTAYNPGINVTLQLRVGISWYRGAR